ncbi:MAG: hypothetical protein R6V27_10145 [Balneolaceae bacterium]
MRTHVLRPATCFISTRGANPGVRIEVKNRQADSLLQTNPVIGG